MAIFVTRFSISFYIFERNVYLLLKMLFTFCFSLHSFRSVWASMWLVELAHQRNFRWMLSKPGMNGSLHLVARTFFTFLEVLFHLWKEVKAGRCKFETWNPYVSKFMRLDTTQEFAKLRLYIRKCECKLTTVLNIKKLCATTSKF